MLPYAFQLRRIHRQFQRSFKEGAKQHRLLDAPSLVLLRHEAV